MRPYYHNPVTQESIWETPLTGVIKELDNIAQLKAEAAASRVSPLREPDVTLLTMSVLLPLLLVLLGLFGLHLYVKKFHPEVIARMIESRKKQRDRTQFRRGRAGPSKHRPPWKMAQAGGAGGRSANS